MKRKTRSRAESSPGGNPGKSKPAIRSGVSGPRNGDKRVSRRDIQRVVDRIVETIEPERVILFGSYAYGKPNQESDVDLLVVMESHERPNLRATHLLGMIRDVKKFPMDVLVRTPNEIQRRLEMKDFFIREILERGKVLYERKPV